MIESAMVEIGGMDRGEDSRADDSRDRHQGGADRAGQGDPMVRRDHHRPMANGDRREAMGGLGRRPAKVDRRRGKSGRWRSRFEERSAPVS